MRNDMTVHSRWLPTTEPFSCYVVNARDGILPALEIAAATARCSMWGAASTTQQALESATRWLVNVKEFDVAMAIKMAPLFPESL